MPASRHPAAARYLERGVFAGLRSFSTLEQRLSELPTDQDRGAAFEVFAEAYLATQPVVLATDVWPADSVPMAICGRLALDTPRDMGVDGVFMTRLGVLNAYQVKFRRGRPSLSWRELATFMGLTDRVSTRVLFTNCDDLPPLMAQRSGFYCIQGTDLDRLQPSDFEMILAWLKGARVAAPKKEPRSHQREALDRLVSAFQRHDRATVVMACGTGKTLVQLWTAEALRCQRVLVLVPSLLLLRQTLHEWLRETRWDDVGYLCVCSDRTLQRGSDAVVVRQADLDFPVTTDPAHVRRFLRRTARSTAPRIIFSTYQSARVVAAGMVKRYPFDLIVFDEAHRTAGRVGAHFSFALKSQHLAARKRAFFTATPRHHAVQQKDRQGDSRLVYSMDDAAVYGPIVHTLSFAEAADRRIICRYKVLISVVTSEMVNEAALRRGEVLVAGDVVKARQVACQIALQKATEQFPVHRIITFHPSVASAESFTAPDGQGIRAHLPAFDAFHVNGQMPMARRTRLITAFREAKRSVVSNARCLTEGVDVPAVDLVAFLSPRRSRVDIVQAVGRAMRHAPDKSVGYVLLPLFVNAKSGESIADAVSRGAFEDVWDVLQAMQEQDAPLAETIRQMREERGRTGGFDDARFRERVEVLGPAVGLETLRQAITTICLDRLGRSWDERYGELRAFRDANGHCNISRSYANAALAQWVNNQRAFRRRKMLSAERIRRLTSIGFTWDVLDATWDAMCEALGRFRAAEGHCNVPRTTHSQGLANWVNKHRFMYQRRRLSADRIGRLTEMGFVWQPKDAAWEQMCARLTAFRAREGHCRVPRRWHDDPALATWVHDQRNHYLRGALRRDRQKRLTALGFEWTPHDQAWETNYAALRSFRDTHGHCNVSIHSGANRALGRWVNRQRAAKATRTLSADRLQRLGELGFVWNVHDAAWEEMFSVLLAFREAHSHCNVPQQYKDNPRLGRWGNFQRYLHKRKQLSRERVRRLAALGFAWEPRTGR